MLVQHYISSELAPVRLDAFLAHGWFRSSFLLYKAELICYEGKLHSVINIRTKLQAYQPSKSLRKVLRRNDARFRTVIGPARIDADRERLYKMHKERFGGVVYNGLKYFFYGEHLFPNPFDTYELAVYDGERLVAVSYFDMGRQGMASLLGLYDKAYNKHSLGMYTMLKEVEYAQSLGLKYYYPGYILDKTEALDYKLRLGATQYYNWETMRWRKWQSRKAIPSVADAYLQRLKDFNKHLRASNIRHRIFLNPYFSNGSYQDSPYIQGAAFIYLYIKQRDAQGVYLLIIEYWPEEDTYVLSLAQSQLPKINKKVIQIRKTRIELGNNFPLMLLYHEQILKSKDPKKLIQRIKRDWEPQYLAS